MEALTRTSAWNPARRCKGTNRRGEQCSRQPISGGDVCVMHGGAAPQVQAAAKTRLLKMVEPVLATFEEILSAWHRTVCTGCGHVDENGVKCTGCGKPTGDPSPVIRVGQLVLDRSGFHPTLAVEQAEPPNEFDNLSIDQTIDELERMLADCREMRDNVLQHALLTGGTFDEGFEISDPEAVDSISAAPDPPEAVRENTDTPESRMVNSPRGLNQSDRK